jgi:hypothetical protein
VWFDGMCWRQSLCFCLEYPEHVFSACEDSQIGLFFSMCVWVLTVRVYSEMFFEILLSACVEPALQVLNVETRLPMLAEGSRSGISLLFLFGITMSEGLFFAVFLDFSLKRGALQRTTAFHIGFVLL